MSRCVRERSIGGHGGDKSIVCVGVGGGDMLACLCERISSFYSIPFTLCLMRQLYMLPFIACRLFYYVQCFSVCV